MELVIFGIIRSVELALMALGFTLVYGIGRLPNFAHGALYVLAGYLTWLAIHRLGLPYWSAALLGLGLTSLVGAAIYQLVLARVRGMPISEIIASYAIGLAILEGLKWQGLKGATFTLKPFIEGGITVFGVPLDYQRLVIIVGGMALFGFFWLFVAKTKLGLAFKGMAQDERAALTLGIDSDHMAVLSMAMGSGLAGVAALIIMPLGNIQAAQGYDVLIMAVAVCVVGGLGSWTGAIMAAFIIGFAQLLTEKYLGSHFRVVTALMAIVITLIFRPSGLFGRQKELEERV
jgi:branched-chain amino acid transport system permease protein